MPASRHAELFVNGKSQGIRTKNPKEVYERELNTKYIVGDMSGLHNGEFRYYHELVEKFHNPLRVGAYVIAFIFLALHLLHGFNSAFQSVGANNKYTKSLKSFGTAYATLIPLGFIVIALFHYFNHTH